MVREKSCFHNKIKGILKGVRATTATGLERGISVMKVGRGTPESLHGLYLSCILESRGHCAVNQGLQ